MTRRAPVSVTIVVAIVGLTSMGWPHRSDPLGPTSDPLPRKIRVDGFVFPKEDVGYQYTVLGVADLTGAKPVCWDTAGNVDAFLTRSLAEALQRGVVPPVRTVPDKKNRYLVVALTIHHNGRAAPVVADRIEQDTAYANAVQLDSRKNGPPPKASHTTVTAMPFTADIDKATASFFLKRTLKLPEQPRIRLIPGETVSTEGHTLTYSNFEQGAYCAIPSTVSPDGEWWSLVFQCNEPRDDPAEYYVQVFGTDGNPVSHTDRAGTPVSGTEWASLRNQDLRTGKLDLARPFGDHFRIPAPGGNFCGTDGMVRVLLSLNPSFVSQVQIDAYIRQEVEMAGIPLDPKRT